MSDHLVDGPPNKRPKLGGDPFQNQNDNSGVMAPGADHMMRFNNYGMTGGMASQQQQQWSAPKRTDIISSMFDLENDLPDELNSCSSWGTTTDAPSNKPPATGPGPGQQMQNGGMEPTADQRLQHHLMQGAKNQLVGLGPVLKGQVGGTLQSPPNVSVSKSMDPMVASMHQLQQGSLSTSSGMIMTNSPLNQMPGNTLVVSNKQPLPTVASMMAGGPPNTTAPPPQGLLQGGGQNGPVMRNVMPGHLVNRVQSPLNIHLQQPRQPVSRRNLNGAGVTPYSYGTVAAPAQRPVPPTLSAIQQPRFPTSIVAMYASDRRFPRLKVKFPSQSKVNWNIEKSDWVGDVEARKLQNAIFGYDSTEQIIADVLGAVTQNRRANLVQSYWKLTGRKLSSDLKSTLAGDLEKVCQKIVAEPRVLLARKLHRAVTAFPIVERDYLLSLICERSGEEVRDLKESYLNKFGRRVDDDLRLHCADNAEIACALLNSHRRDDSNSIQVHQDAILLQKLGVGIAYGDLPEPVIYFLLRTRSFAHLRAVFAEYKRLVGSAIENSVPPSMPVARRESLISALRAVAGPEMFAARVLGRTDPQFYLSTLLTFRLTRSREFWRYLEQMYLELYNVRIKDELVVHTSGEATTLLLNLLEL
ncbi:Domain of Unknown Function (DUF902) [Nesidiocoris tenuis]|uniref:Annexin n=1 Tax=Nesidiocoris tenuis TaxID=355587 RepID=A0ABN7BC56_9HEMI|nr:Domain of Unknown Function (DUF902) [Nesidiocoris tenuis]